MTLGANYCREVHPTENGTYLYKKGDKHDFGWDDGYPETEEYDSLIALLIDLGEDFWKNYPDNPPPYENVDELKDHIVDKNIEVGF